MIPVMIPVGFDVCGEYYYECKCQEDATIWIIENDEVFPKRFIEMGHAVGTNRPGKEILVDDLIFRVYLFDTYHKFLKRKSGKIEDNAICRTVVNGRVVNFTSMDAYRYWIDMQAVDPDDDFFKIKSIEIPMSEEFPEFAQAEERLAKWLHEKYLEFALEEGWQVQDNTDGSWEKLPIKNKMVMLKMGRLLHQRDIDDLLYGIR